MTEVRVLSATGMLGSGFMESSFERGISLKPHVIGCDGGSTDGGPAYLGAGDRYFSKEAAKRDVRLMMAGRDKLDVPLIIGSCGMAGGGAGVHNRDPLRHRILCPGERYVQCICDAGLRDHRIFLQNPRLPSGARHAGAHPRTHGGKGIPARIETFFGRSVLLHPKSDQHGAGRPDCADHVFTVSAGEVAKTDSAGPGAR